MAMEIEATYDHGLLRLAGALPLQEGQKVRVIIQPAGGAAQRLAGLIPWTGSPEELERFLSDPDEGALERHEV